MFGKLTNRPTPSRRSSTKNEEFTRQIVKTSSFNRSFLPGVVQRSKTASRPQSPTLSRVRSQLFRGIFTTCQLKSLCFLGKGTECCLPAFAVTVQSGCEWRFTEEANRALQASKVVSSATHWTTLVSDWFRSTWCQAPSWCRTSGRTPNVNVSSL